MTILPLHKKNKKSFDSRVGLLTYLQVLLRRELS